jgi:outer membrane lipoprotein carrier protein
MRCAFERIFALHRIHGRFFQWPASRAVVILLVGFGGMLDIAHAQDAPMSGVELLRQFLAGAQTLQADFRQELLGPGHETIETASGSLSIRRPGRFAWRYAEPIVQLIVADGENLWIYDADLAQATVTALDDAAPASPAMLLSGEASLDTEFDVLEELVVGDTTWVRLAPKRNGLDGSDFKEVRVGFRDGSISELQLLDSLDQTTLLEFSDVQVGIELPENEFEFELPPGVDLIGEAG